MHLLILTGLREAKMQGEAGTIIQDLKVGRNRSGLALTQGQSGSLSWQFCRGPRGMEENKTVCLQTGDTKSCCAEKDLMESNYLEGFLVLKTFC